MSSREIEAAPLREDRLLSYATGRPEPRRRPWRVDWVIVVTAIPCALWIWGNVALLLGQPHNAFSTTEDELFALIFMGTALSSPAIALFLIVVCLRLWVRGRRRERTPRDL